MNQKSSLGGLGNWDSTIMWSKIKTHLINTMTITIDCRLCMHLVMWFKCCFSPFYFVHMFDVFFSQICFNRNKLAWILILLNENKQTLYSSFWGSYQFCEHVGPSEEWKKCLLSDELAWTLKYSHLECILWRQTTLCLNFSSHLNGCQFVTLTVVDLKINKLLWSSKLENIIDNEKFN